MLRIVNVGWAWVTAGAAASCFGAAGCSCGESVLDHGSRHDDAGAGAGGKKTDGGHGGQAADGGGNEPDAYSPETGVRSKSGSQITVLGLRSGDAETGATSPALRDEKHGVICSTKLAADGSVRCLPDDDVVVFTDSGCTQPIAIDQTVASCKTSDPPTYGIEYWGGDSLCDRSRSSAYELGAPIALPSEVYNQSIFGCVKRTPPNGVPESYREAKPTPLGDWVTFTRETTNVTKDLGVSSLVGTDGSRWVQSLVLLPKGLLCAGATQAGSPTPRCVPSDRVVRSTTGSLFGDSACTETLGGRCEPNPKLIENFDPNETIAPSGSCTAPRFPKVGALFEVGKEIDHSEIYWGLPDSCSIAPDSQIMGAFLYYTSGASVPFEGYPVVGQLFSGTGRLQEIFYVAEDGTKLFAAPSIFYDTVAKEDCHPADVLGTGLLVCMPDTALANTFPGIGGLFGDASCTTHLATGGGCGSKTAALMSETRTFPTGETIDCPVSLNRITTHAGPVYGYHSSFPPVPPGPSGPPGASCEATMSQPNNAYDIGEAVAPDAIFPPLEQVDL